MADVGRHPNIELLTLSEVQQVDGYVGNFKVKVLKQARYVDEQECTACADCLEVCPVVQPDEFNMGLASRKAIYQGFPQAVPSAFLIDMEDCLGNEPIACGKCKEVCEKDCIDYDDKDREIELEVGTVNVWEVPGYRIEMSPFGGIKDSGLGYKEGVLEAMKSYTNVKTYSLPWV